MSDSFNTLPVDVTNPGQFFACCGLMEIATLIDPEVTGCFTEQGFEMSVPASDALKLLFEAELTPNPLPQGSRRAKGGTADKIAPLHITHESKLLIVDWWLDDEVADFKTWSGGQSASGAAIAMHDVLPRIGAVPGILNNTVETDAKPYYYDCRSGGNAIDLGFMDSGLTTLVYAATELLAFIGLQRFRPDRAGDARWGRRYATWSKPLSLSIAVAVAACVLPPLEHQRWRYKMTWRDSSGRFKAFGRSHQENTTVLSNLTE